MAMTKRQTQDVERLFGDLRASTTRKVPHPTARGKDRQPLQIPALDELERRTRELLAADEQIDRPDGYSSTTPGNGAPGGGKGGGPQMHIPADDEDDAAWLRTTSTESAALRLADEDQPPVPDIVHREAVTAMREGRKAADALRRMKDALDRWENLRSIHKVDDPPYCYVAQVIHKLPYSIEWEPWRETDFAGQLQQPFDEKRRVCSFVYWFVRNHKRLPTRNEMLSQLERGVVKMSAS